MTVQWDQVCSALSTQALLICSWALGGADSIQRPFRKEDVSDK